MSGDPPSTWRIAGWPSPYPTSYRSSASSQQAATDKAIISAENDLSICTVSLDKLRHYWFAHLCYAAVLLAVLSESRNRRRNEMPVTLILKPNSLQRNAAYGPATDLPRRFVKTEQHQPQAKPPQRQEPQKDDQANDGSDE